VRSVVKAVWLSVAGFISVPVYFAFEALVRIMNLGRLKYLDAGQLVVLKAVSEVSGCETLATVELDKVRIAARATLPIRNTAVALGRDVFISLDRDELRGSLLVHELVHVAQREELGRIGMAMEYGRGWVDGFSYRHHHMEVAARRVESAAASSDVLRVDTTD
jgi:hypothetical protein